MKYKRGKGRKPRRQQKVYKMKTGGMRFLLSGKTKSPTPISMMDGNFTLKGLLQDMGFRIRER